MKYNKLMRKNITELLYNKLYSKKNLNTFFKLYKILLIKYIYIYWIFILIIILYSILSIYKFIYHNQSTKI